MKFFCMTLDKNSNFFKNVLYTVILLLFYAIWKEKLFNKRERHIATRYDMLLRMKILTFANSIKQIETALLSLKKKKLERF